MPGISNRKKAEKVREQTHQFLCRIPEPLFKELRVWSAKEGVSLNNALVRLVREAWSKNPDREMVARLAGTKDETKR